MKRIVSWLMAGVVLGIVTPRVMAADVVTSGCEIDYPPFCIVDTNGVAGGFSVELLRAALRAMGRDVTFETGPWDEVMRSLADGKVQALPLVGRTPEREEVFDFTFPYLTMHGAIVVRQDAGGIEDLGDLKGRRVAVMKGDNAEEFLRRENRGIRIVTTPTFTDAFRGLSEGRYDAVVIQRLVGMRLLQETGLANLRMLKKPIMDFRQDFCFAVREGDRDTLALLNEGLALVIADGTHRRLHAKWFAAMELPAHRRIVVGGDHNYPPFEFIDKDGRPAGFNVDLTRAIAREMGLDIEIQLGRWSDILAAMKSGEIDAIQGMFYAPSRESEYDFSPPHSVNHYVGVVRKGSVPPTAFDELNARRVVVQEGDVIHDVLVEKGLEDNVSLAGSQEEVLRGVAEGRYDCALAVRVSSLYFIQKNGWANLVIGKRPFRSFEYCYAVPKGSQALLAEFSEGLRAVEESGEYRDIYAKWLGVYEENEHGLAFFFRRAAWIVLPLLLVLAVSLAWSYMLRKQVALQTAELRESERRFRTLADSGQALVWTSGLDRKCDYFNKTWLDFTGRTLEQELGDGWVEGVNPDDVARCLEVYTTSFDRREPFSMTYRLRRHDGVYRMIRDDGVPRYDSRERFLGYIGHCFDITELNEAMETLRHRETLLAIAGKAVKLGGWSVILTEQRVVWSDEVAAIHEMPPGFSPSVEDGISFYAPECRDRIREVFGACARDGVPFDEELQIVTGKGRRVWVRTIGMAERDESGRIVKLQGAFQDITGLKKTDEQIRSLLTESDRARAALLSILEDQKRAENVAREKSAFLDTLLNAIPVPVFYKDLQGRYIGCNAAFAEFFGRSKESLVGMTVFDIAPRELAETYDAKDRELLRAPGMQTYDSQVKDARGNAHEVIFHKAAFVDAAGKVAGVVGAILDITDRKERDSLRIAKEVAEASSRAKSEFLATMSHEFRTPLNSVIGFTEAIQDRVYGAVTDRQREALANILSGADLLRQLVNDILDLSRIEAGKMHIELGEVRLRTFVEQSLILVRSGAEARGQELVLEYPQELEELSIRSDERRLKQVMANILANASKFTPDGGRIAVTVARTDGEVRIAIADTGIGVRQEDRERIFEDFQQGDSSYVRKHAGIGLGLSLVRKLLGLLGGRVWVESEGEGKGSTFTIALPLDAPGK